MQVIVPVMRAQQTRARGVCPLQPSPQCVIECCLCDLAPGNGHCFAAAPAEWPGETATDQQPLAEHLQHQTGTHTQLPQWKSE